MTTMDDLDHAEFGRLLGRGLPVRTALQVLRGERNEDFEVEHVETTARARAWCAGLTTLPQGLEPRWDLAPEHFYLALDGEHPSLADARAWGLILADTAQVLGALTYASTRDKDPWDEGYRIKSCGTAYRWSVGLSVTPPLLAINKTCIHIAGGMHRFHLAVAYGAGEMPFLVEPAALAAMVALLPSARVI
ncbi:hypothetical protein [Sphingomonas sanguinis]|nr:hypothetical protein [Sphingomonas sanguinis]